jgi:tetratricopeptide (TPR) repeat protein
MTKAPWILTVLLFACDVSSLAAQERWLELTSDHYRVLGNVEERDLEETAARFEAFHSAVSEMFSPRQYPDLRPTTVVVFDDDDGLEVLGLEGREGYFFADAREHYVAMRTESNGRRPFDALLHDYFHAIAEESIPNAPLWLKEGLAEFYRTAIWSDDGSQLQIGRPIDAFIRSVREDGTRLSFDELTAVGRDSNLYDEIGRDDVFHAQSWAFVHYLITLNQGQGYGQTIRFVRLVASGDGFEQAVEDAFGANFRTVLAGFENNVQERGTYPYLTLRAVDSARGIGQSRPEVMSEAEVEAELSGLLMRRGAADEAELRLREALAVSPNAVAPMRMLARLLIDQGQFDEARLSLESGLGPSGFDAPTNYFYALAILGDGSRIDDSRLDLARAALRDAIRLDPEFADAHHELALTYLLPSARDEGLDEAVELVDHALELKPRNHEYRFSLVRILIEQERFTDARTALLPLVD